MSDNTKLSRRKFLVSSAASGFLLSTHIPFNAAHAKNNAPHWQANAFIAIDKQSKVTFKIKHIEFGQGTYTGLATLLAEELDADWDQVSCEHAPADASKYRNLRWGPIQGTGGSTAIANSYMQMREAGATVRAMLVSAAAQYWKAPEEDITVDSGLITNRRTKKTLSFGDLAELASTQPQPEKITLKDPKDFKLIGKNVSRKDVGKTDGSAVFTQDIQLPDMLTALVAHPPRFGAKVGSFDASQALAINGVVDVFEIDTGVAVLAETFWQAKMGRDQLKIDWDESGVPLKSSQDQMREYAKLADEPGAVALDTGDTQQAFKNADKVFEADFEFPYLAHATMEPMNCVVQLALNDNNVSSAQLWYGAQIVTLDQMAVAKYLGVSPQDVAIHTVFAGGSFGRRGSSKADYVLEATQIAKKSGKSVPIKMVWTREDDTKAGSFRPAFFHRLKAGVDKKGNIVAWQHRIVGQSLAAGTPMEAMIKNGIDESSVEGATELPYAIPNMRVELHSPRENVPVLWWRSVGSTHTAYSTEVFIDQIAKGLDKDPLQYRMDLLGEDPRYRGVLETVAEKSGWAEKRKSQTSLLGIAVHKSFGSYVAQVVEAKKTNAGYKLERVTCAVDCGIAVNPDVIKAQMEGGIGYGLSPAMYSKITLTDSAVVESNFHDYQVIRMSDMPKVDTFIIPSAEPPTGVGEPSTPVIVPALANALDAADSEAVNSLPLKVTFS